MNTLRTNFGILAISLLINVGLIYRLLHIINYSNFINVNYLTVSLIFLSPFLHFFIFLLLVKNIFKKDTLFNIRLYFGINTIYFLLSYVLYYYLYSDVYIYNPLFSNNPLENDVYSEVFSNVYSETKVAFMLFMISLLGFATTFVYRKNKKSSRISTFF